MRHLLTAVGILLVIVLAAAMAVPHFVDFAQHRRFFEQQIAAATGHPAHIDGAIAIRLLPTPSVTVRRLRLGPVDAQGFSMFEASRIYGALAASALLRGEFHITEAIVDAPIVRIGTSGLEPLLAAGRGATGAAAPAISIERLVINDGTAVIERKEREALAISEIGGEIEASSLLGPGKGFGSFQVNGARRQVRFAVGRVENGKTRVKALIEDPQLALRMDVDGTAGVGEDSSQRFEGALALVGNTGLGAQDKVQLPLKANARAKVSGSLLSLDEVSVVIGQDNQPLTLTGNGSVRLQAHPTYDLTLAARSYDFDRPGQDGRQRRVVPLTALREAAALFPQGAGAPDVSGRLDLSAGALVVGGQTVIAPHVVLEQSPGGLAILRLDGELPGQTRVAFERDPARSGVLAGALTIDSRDPEKLNGWFNGVARTATAAAATRVSAQLSAIPDGVMIDRVEIDRGDTRLAGQGRYLLPTPGARPAPQLALKLTTARLNVGDIPPFIVNPDRREERPALDFDLDIEASRMALDGRDTGRLTAKVRRDGAITSVERLEIAGLDGASLIASGTLGGGSRRVTVKLDAEKGEGIAAVAQQVFPGAITDGLKARAASLAPALIVASLANDEREDTYDIAAEGLLGGSEVKVSGLLVLKADIALDIRATAANPDSGRLAQQISGTQRKLLSTLPASGSVSLKGNPRATIETRLAGSLFGVNVDLGGTIKLFQPLVPFEGSITAQSPDLYPALSALGVDPQFLARGAAGRLTGKVESNLQQITITDARARIGDVPASGEISFKLAEGGAVAGQIKLPQLDLRPALAGVFGPGFSLFGGGAQWSSAAFARPMPPPLSGDLWIEAESARFDDALVIDQPRFVVRFAPGQLAFEHAHFRLGPARFSGEIGLRRSGPGVFATSRLVFAELDAEKLRLAAKGVAEGEIQAAGSGESFAKIAQTLAGSGVARVKGGAAPGHDPRALQRLLDIPLQHFGPTDAASIARRLDAELAKAPLALPEARFPLVVIDGTLRVGTFGFSDRTGSHELAGTYDIGRLSGDFRITSSLDDAPANWRGAQPMAVAQWRGTLGAMTRGLSVDPLVNGFLAATLQRDAELREIQEQDLRERAYFNRRLKAMEWEKRRIEEARQEAVRAEQARLAEEERLRRQKAAEEAAARRAAEEEQRRQRLAAEEARREAARIEQARQAEEERLRRQKAAEEAAARRLEEEQRRQRLAAEEEQKQRLRELFERAAPPPAAPAPSLMPAPQEIQPQQAQ